MEVQEFVLKAVVTNIRFAPTPRFSDARGELIEALMASHGLPDWTVADQAFELLDRSAPDVHLQASANDLRVSFENTDADECADQTRHAIELVLPALSAEKITYVGVRSWWLAASDSFDELRDWMITRFSPPLPTIVEPVGQKADDVGWVFEFRRSEPEHILRFGPMKAEQAMQQIFRDEDASNYPPQFLFMDLDRMYRSPDGVEIDAALERWESTFKRNLEVAEQVGIRMIAA